jgi:hypothetical protein
MKPTAAGQKSMSLLMQRTPEERQHRRTNQHRTLSFKYWQLLCHEPYGKPQVDFSRILQGRSSAAEAGGGER